METAMLSSLKSQGGIVVALTALLLCAGQADAFHKGPYVKYVSRGYGAPAFYPGVVPLGTVGSVGTTREVALWHGVGVAPYGYGMGQESAYRLVDSSHDQALAELGRRWVEEAAKKSPGTPGTPGGGTTPAPAANPCADLVPRLDALVKRMDAVEARLATVESKLDALIAAKTQEAFLQTIQGMIDKSAEKQNQALITIALAVKKQQKVLAAVGGVVLKNAPAADKPTLEEALKDLQGK
jgi:hypothetical protein